MTRRLGKSWWNYERRSVEDVIRGIEKVMGWKELVKDSDEEDK